MSKNVTQIPFFKNSNSCASIARGLKRRDARRRVGTSISQAFMYVLETPQRKARRGRSTGKARLLENVLEPQPQREARRGFNAGISQVYLTFLRNYNATRAVGLALA
jgi:hypothetical protein